MTKISEKKIKALIKDERMAAKEYRKYNLPQIARDESKHRRILIRMLKKGDRY